MVDLKINSCNQGKQQGSNRHDSGTVPGYNLGGTEPQKGIELLHEYYRLRKTEPRSTR